MSESAIQPGSQSASTGAPCLHFLSKGMFVSGILQPTPETAGMGDGHCWCNMTQYVMGPDRQLVEREACTPGRSCYQPRF